MKKPFLPRWQAAIETLEARIAPASLIFTDADGDSVTITTNRGSNAQLAAAAIFDPLVPGQLQELRFEGVNAFRGTNLTIDSVLAGGGDGQVDVGFVNAAGLDLGRVRVDGDLGRINVGDGARSTPGIFSLEVASVGVSTGTQAAGGDLVSTIVGDLRALTVATDFKDAVIFVGGDVSRLEIGGNLLGGALDRSGSIRATGGVRNVEITGMIQGGDGVESGRIAALRISNVTIGGSLFGGAGLSSGQLASRGLMSQIVIDGITGGSGFESGSLVSTEGIRGITINGDITGGTGEQSGEIASSANLQNVLITGSIVGGTNSLSGTVGSDRDVSAIRVMQDIRGGSGPVSGAIVSKRFVHNVIVDGSVIGGSGADSGAIGSLGGLDQITVKTNVQAGTGDRSGVIICDAPRGPSIGRVHIGTILGLPETGIAGFRSGGVLSGHLIDFVEVDNDIIGGNSSDAGGIIARNGISRAIVHGDIRGGDGESSGSIHSTFGLGSVVVDGDVVGGAGFGSGAILSDTTMRAVTIHGSLIGGSGFLSGRIETDGDGAQGNMGRIVIDGEINGGPNFGNSSGLVFSSGAIASVRVGSLVGTTASGGGAIISGGNMGTITVLANVQGGDGRNSGKISSGGRIDHLDIRGSLIGGNGDYSNFRAEEVVVLGETGGFDDDIGQVFAGRGIGRVDVGGSIVGSGGDFSAQVRAASIGTVVVRGSVTGGFGFNSGSVIAEETDLGSVRIAGDLGAGFGFMAGHIGAARDIGSIEVNRLAGVLSKGAAEVFITAGGDFDPKNPGDAVAIGRVTVNDSTFFANVLAGYDIEGRPVNPRAQIGSVLVGTGTGAGTWQATDVAAGWQSGQDGQFGTLDDTPIFSEGQPAAVSRIASVVVRGEILETPFTSDRFGIVAGHVVSVRVGGVAISLERGPENDFASGGSLGDVRILETIPAS